MKIGVILGSTREVRRGARVATWLMGELQKISGAEFELVDLRDYPLPFFQEDNSAMSLQHDYSTPVATEWAAKVGEFDGFIFLVSEYNHGPTAVLKNALDYVYYQWNKKPVAFVSYATGVGAGIRAVEQLRQIVIELEMAPMQAALHIGHVAEVIDEDGKLLQPGAETRVPVVAEQLLWWANALKSARDNQQ
jgi:NAD(P)H-dependent FMN reductase